VRVERLADEFALQFDVCAYDLRPDIPPEGLSRELASSGRVYPAGYLDNMRQMALESGIEMKRPALIPNTHRAHEATEFARAAGQLLEFHRAAFKAYWTDERNIGDVAVLCEIASECGMDAEALRRALDDGRYAGEVLKQMEWARGGRDRRPNSDLRGEVRGSGRPGLRHLPRRRIAGSQRPAGVAASAAPPQGFAADFRGLAQMAPPRLPSSFWFLSLVNPRPIRANPRPIPGGGGASVSICAICGQKGGGRAASLQATLT
jgi:hypothetical protein